MYTAVVEHDGILQGEVMKKIEKEVEKLMNVSPERRAKAERFAHTRILESINATLQDVFEIKGHDLRYMPRAKSVDAFGAEVTDGFVCRHRGEYFKVEDDEKVPLKPYRVYVTADMRDDVLVALIAAEEAYELHLDRAHDALIKDRARMLGRLEKVEGAQSILNEARARWPEISGLIYYGRHEGMEFTNLCLLNAVLPVIEGRCRREHEHRLKDARRGIAVRHRAPADIIEFEEMIKPNVERTLTKIRAALDERMREWISRLWAWKSKSRNKR